MCAPWAAAPSVQRVEFSGNCAARGWRWERVGQGSRGPPRRAYSALLPGLYTAYSAHLHRDKALLKRLLKVQAGGRPGEGWGGEPALGEGVHVASSARAPLLGAAKEEAVGHTDSTAETAPAGAHTELHHPPGEARGRAGEGTRLWPQAHSQPPLPRSTTWPASCPCRRASHPGRCGSRWPSGGSLGGRRSSSVWEVPGL